MLPFFMRIDLRNLWLTCFPIDFELSGYNTIEWFVRHCLIIYFMIKYFVLSLQYLYLKGGSMKTAHDRSYLKWWLLLAIAGMAALMMVSCSTPVEFDADFQKLMTYTFGDSREPLMVIQDRIRASYGDAEERLNLELQLAELLKIESSWECKDFACRQLMIVGTKKSVKALSGLFGNEKTADMARFALEKINDPSADKALCDALEGASGKTLVGIINSLGERRSASSVSALEGFASNADSDVAKAAKDALAKIDN